MLSCALLTNILIVVSLKALPMCSLVFMSSVLLVLFIELGGPLHVYHMYKVLSSLPVFTK